MKGIHAEGAGGLSFEVALDLLVGEGSVALLFDVS
jgi:hypothetical protein